MQSLGLEPYTPVYPSFFIAFLFKNIPLEIFGAALVCAFVTVCSADALFYCVAHYFSFRLCFCADLACA